MLHHPRFKPHLRVQVVPGEGVFVVSDARQVLLRGRLYEVVAPCLGGHSPDELCEHLHEQASPSEIYFVLGQLEAKGFLCEAEESLPPGEAAYWSARQIEPGEAARRLAATAVSIRAFGVEAAPLGELLQAMHVRVEENADHAIALADDYLRAELAAYNAEALRAGRPWLLVRPVGRQIWVGPLFRPGATGCWECLAQRLRANCPVATYLDAKDGRPSGAADPACTPATLCVAWGLAADAVAAWVARGDLPALDGKIQTYDMATGKAETHSLVRLPYCPACSQPPVVAWSGDHATTAPPVVAWSPDHAITAPVLQSRLKTFTGDGGHRVVSPEATLEQYGRHVSPLTGAVSRLERVAPAGDGVMHVYIAGHNLARRHRSLEHLRGDLRNMSSGKGASDAQARASGLCEGLERYSGVYRGDEPRRRASLHRLGDAAVPPNDCMLFSDRQYRERDAWNARLSYYHFVPAPLDPDAEIEWTPVWSLTRGEPRYLPTAFCYFNYPHGDGDPFCLACSNGNAAGNTLEEAILQGFFELVERDSVALWWYNRVRLPGVDLDSFADPYLGRLREYLRSRDREFWAVDLTSDLNVPVFVAASRVTTGPEERIVLGFGAHLDAHVALLRAVTEMNQMLASLLQRPGPEVLSDKIQDQETVHWLRTATAANQPYLLPDEKAPRREAGSYPRSWTDDVADDVRACQALVERRGMEMLVLDQTRSEIGLPVVKVMVPGLRHFWARYAPGRLYDVPVRLGWSSRPPAEDELNPIPMFL